jgi:hypothetical protein
MKELGKMLVRSRLPIRRMPQSENGESTQDIPYSKPMPHGRPGVSSHDSKVPEKQTSANPNDVYRDLESWRPSARSVTIPEGIVEQIMTPEEFANVHRVGRKAVPEKKKRGVCLSMSVSPEEAEVLRRYAASVDLTFSEWARATLFQSMGRKLPKRPGNPKDKEK